jgi:monomeric isocitrate dehydrogenase
MNSLNSEKKDIGQIFREGTAIDEAVDRAYRRAVKQHRQNGVPMVFWENGKIIEVPADQLPDLSID